MSVKSTAVAACVWIWWALPQADECQENSVMDSRWKSGGRKGVTNRLRREPCAGPREVSVAVRVGRAIERRNATSGVPRLYQRPKAIPSDRFREGARAPRRLRTQARTYVHAGDTERVPIRPGGRTGAAEERRWSESMTNGLEQSDLAIVCAGQRPDQVGSSPTDARVRGVISKGGGNASLAGVCR